MSIPISLTAGGRVIPADTPIYVAPDRLEKAIKFFTSFLGLYYQDGEITLNDNLERQCFIKSVSTDTCNIRLVEAPKHLIFPLSPNRFKTSWPEAVACEIKKRAEVEGYSRCEICRDKDAPMGYMVNLDDLFITPFILVPLK